MAAAITILALVSLLVASFAFHGTAGASTRGLLQTSGSCNTYIPGCMPGRCSVKVVAGRQQSVCERCISSFTSSRDGLQCVCPPGRYYVPAAGGDAAACVKCGAAFFCKGGKETADNDNNAAEDLGLRQSCYKGEVNSNDNRTLVEAKGLTTKTEFAKKHNDCVPRPGWFLKGTTEALQEADLCPARTYSPGFGRIRRCLRCQSGTAESDLITFASLPAHVGTLQLRTDRFTVCQVPPGSYLVQNVVRPCPAGTFRSSFSRSTEESSKFCFSCPYGISTSVPRATNQTACNVVGPGINIDSQGLQAAQAAAADNAASGGGIGIILNATLCNYGFYFEGGVVPASGFTCKQCPDGTTTQKTGSTHINDCMVPPGYYIKTGTTTSMQLCPGNVTKDGYQTGYYRAGWVYYNDSSVREAGDGSGVCTKCGDGILSTPTDSDESNGGNSSTALVAASSWSCYIEAGWGISVVGVNETTNLPIFRAEICAINSYGVENTTFGLQGAPCKPCQRNLVTLAPGANNASQCVNPAGVGYDPSGGEPCPQGYYAAAGSLLPCNRCPPGRTTNTSQISITDCVVQEGHGVFDGDWVPASGLTPEELVNLTALPCPLGYFGAGGDVGSICSPCPDNKWTQQEGSTLAECSVCKPGYGRDVTTIPGTLQCPQCGIGLWSDGETPCTLCPSTNFIFTSSRRPNGREDSYNSTGHTLKLGATGQEECVPQTQQFGIDIGHVTINSSLYTPVTSPTVGSWGSSGPTVPQCISECPATQCCFVRFDYIFGNQGQGNGNAQTTCRQARLVANTVATSPWTGTQNLVFVKLVYAQAISAASVDTGKPNSGLITEAATGSDDEVKTKAMSSGLYSRCDMPAGWTDLSRVGVAIGPTSTVSNAATLQACKSRCDMMSTCWGFTVTGTGTRVCQLRSGEAQMNVRSFFANPNPTSFTAAFPSGLNWY